jgi:phage-related protein
LPATIVVEILTEVVEELAGIPARERYAINSAFEKLRELGDALGYPHSSAVREAPGLRELRPRQGRSPWRAFYSRVDDRLFVIAAIGPEAQNNPRAFRRAVILALKRLAELEQTP